MPNNDHVLTDRELAATLRWMNNVPNASDFSLLAPLITSDRLRRDFVGVFKHLPPWALEAFPLGASEPYDKNLAVVKIDPYADDTFYCEPVAYAVLCELTRYGGQLIAVCDRGDEFLPLEGMILDYGDVRFPVGIILPDVLHGQAGERRDLRSLRNGTLRRVPHRVSGNARCDLLVKAHGLATAAGITASSKSDYLANIVALMNMHDKVCRIVEVA